MHLCLYSLTQRTPKLLILLYSSSLTKLFPPALHKATHRVRDQDVPMHDTSKIMSVLLAAVCVLLILVPWCKDTIESDYEESESESESESTITAANQHSSAVADTCLTRPLPAGDRPTSRPARYRRHGIYSRRKCEATNQHDLIRSSSSSNNRRSSRSLFWNRFLVAHMNIGKGDLGKAKRNSISYLDTAYRSNVDAAI